MSEPSNTNLGESSGSSSRVEGKKTKLTRSKLGCLTCRGRKVKCDESLPECKNCQRIGSECTWPNNTQINRRLSNLDGSSLLEDAKQIIHISTDFNHEDDGVLGSSSARSKSTTTKALACEACRVAKVRCSQTRPRCSRCNARGIRCEYLRRSSPSNDRRFSIPEVTSPGITHSEVSRSDFERHLDAFYVHVYPISGNAVIHRGRLYQDISENRLSPILSKAICAVSARFLDGADPTHPDGGIQAAIWAREARLDLMDTLNALSEAKIIAALFLSQHEANSGRYASGWILVSMAVRMIFAMRLNVETPISQPPLSIGSETGSKSVWVEKEVRRRIMWCAYALDRIGCAGIPEYTTVQDKMVKVALPISNHFFELGIEMTGRQLGEVRRSQSQVGPLRHGQDGIFSRYCRLMAIRGNILTFVKHLGDYDTMAWDPKSPFQDCLLQLRHWRATLPAELEMTISNMYYWKATNEVFPLVALHLWYDQLHCDLYRIAMPNFSESAPTEYLAQASPDWITQSRWQCYLNACSITQRFSLLDSTFPDLIPTDRMVETLAYESIRNQLQYLRVAHGGRQEDAAYSKTVEGFELTLRIIGRTTKYYSNVQPVLRDLSKMLIRHGFVVDSNFQTQSGLQTSGARSPVGGPVLSRMHWISRDARYPKSESSEAGTSPTEFKWPSSRKSAGDGKTPTPLTTSPQYVSIRSTANQPEHSLDNSNSPHGRSRQDHTTLGHLDATFNGTSGGASAHAEKWPFTNQSSFGDQSLNLLDPSVSVSEPISTHRSGQNGQSSDTNRWSDIPWASPTNSIMPGNSSRLDQTNSLLPNNVWGDLNQQLGFTDLSPFLNIDENWTAGFGEDMEDLPIQLTYPGLPS